MIDSRAKTSITPERLWLGLKLWARKQGLARKFAFGLALSAFLSGVATVLVMGSATDVSSGDDTRLVLSLLVLDAILAASLSIFVGHRLVRIWLERRSGRAGSGLYLRMIGLFSLVAAIPAILMAVVSLIFLDQGLEAWFSAKVSTALGRSEVVARAYLEEHRKNFRADALELANQINANAAVLAVDPGRFSNALTTLAGRYDMAEAYVVDSEQKILAQSAFSFTLALDQETAANAFLKAIEGGIIVLSAGKDDRVRVLVRLTRFRDAFLVVGRYLDSRVLGHLAEIKQAVGSYKMVEEKRQGIQITFGLIFVVTAVLLVLAAIWLGLTFAHQIASPISDLIEAAEKVRDGDLNARVDATQATDEIGALSRAFNRMTSELGLQKKSLIDANFQLDERRRFTETVLEGVSAGVIGLDHEARITLPNRSASLLLGIALEDCLGDQLEAIVPAMRDLVHNAQARPKGLHRTEVRILRDELVKTLDVRMAAETFDDVVMGYVVTFDDVTDLNNAQRKAAWSDVARRIAHEIKNPLTPIQLAAERLKRKYRKEITTDPDTFENCTNTIIRQVEDIGRLVDEFSAFARMPEPELKPENLSELCRQAVFLEKNRQLDMRLDLLESDRDIWISCDQRQIARALANLLKNAVEAVSEDLHDKGKPVADGWVGLSLVQNDDDVVAVVVEDNGPGLPKVGRDKLTEPYVTSRVKGTGLGLAIVNKIMEDHQGHLELADRDDGGAKISMVFSADAITDPGTKQGSGDAESKNPEGDALNLAAGIR